MLRPGHTLTDHTEGTPQMAARHQAHTDQQYRRYAELRFMMGTGAGISRTPAKLQTIVAQIAQHKGTATPFIWPGYRGVDLELKGFTKYENALPILTHRGIGISTIEHYDEYDGVPMETDMGHYWKLAREKRALEIVLKQYVPGHAFLDHTSPFGPDRFRKFDPLPAFDTIIAPGPFSMCVINC